MPDRKEHYKYNLIHVTLSKYKALEHSIIQEHGSEVIDRCVALYRLLEQSKISFTIPRNYDKYNLKCLANTASNPIVFEISHISDGNLIKEDDREAKPALDFIHENIGSLSEIEKRIFLYDCNFKITKPIPPSKISLKRIVKDENKTPPFNYILYD